MSKSLKKGIYKGQNGTLATHEVAGLALAPGQIMVERIDRSQNALGVKLATSIDGRAAFGVAVAIGPSDPISGPCPIQPGSIVMIPAIIPQSFSYNGKPVFCTHWTQIRVYDVDLDKVD